MKQFLYLLAGGALIGCLSCNEKSSDTTAATKANSMVEKNLAAYHAVDRAFQTGDVSMIDSVVAADFVDHGDRGETNRDSLKAMITLMHSKAKDMKMTTVKELADDEYVMGWSHYTGTSDGSMGMPAGPYDFNSVEVVKFKDGKAVEHWSFMQPSDMMKMMAPPPPPAEKKGK